MRGPDPTFLAAEADRYCTGRLGLVARHLNTGEELRWRDTETFRTASTVKVAIHAAVLSAVRSGIVDADRRVTVRPGQATGGAGVLMVLRPGLAPTVADLCTLMIVVSDNTATNLLIDLVGGVDAVNEFLRDAGLGGIELHRRLAYAPPPLVAGPQPVVTIPPGPFATASPDAMFRLVSAVAEGELVDPAACAAILATMAHQQNRTGIPRLFFDLREPGDPPEPLPTLASKTGAIPGCRSEVGVLGMPGGGRVAFAVMVDDLLDMTMTPFSEGDDLLGEVGAGLLRQWWDGPGPVPLRPERDR